MATLALYRAWRPARFSDMVGQEAAVTTLRNQVATGGVAHAYLFCGSRGTGKTTAAKIFARAVNCLNPDAGDPCGHCAACVALSAENNLDIIEIDAASNNGVDEIRDLRDKIKYPPQHGRYRVYIIDEVHMLSTGAFNALLKTLEEPPSHALFILATTEPQRLPATVLSRCQRYDFRRFPAKQIIQRMRTVLEGEHGEATDEALTLIARAAEGGMRDALSLLDMCLAYGGHSVDGPLVREVLGAADKGFLFTFADHLIQGEAGAALAAIDQLMDSGREPQVFARDVTGHLRGVLLAQTCGDSLTDLLEITQDDASDYVKQAAKISRDRLLAVLDLFLAAETDMKWSSQPRIALEVAAVRSCLPEKAVQLASLASRLDIIEKRLESGAAVQPSTQQTAKAQKPEKAQAKAAEPLKSPQAIPAPNNGVPSDFWAQAMKLIKNESHLYATLMQGKYAGIEGDTVCVAYGKDGGIFKDMLKRPDRQSRLEEVFSQVAGKPMTVRVDVDTGATKAQDVRIKQNVLQGVFDLFGREHVEVVDEKQE